MPVTVDGPGLLDVTVWQGPDAITVHLVNLTNPMTMRGAYRELLPVGPLRVDVRVPDGFVFSRARLLRADTDVAYERIDGLAQIVVPQVVALEVVAPCR